MLQSNCWLGSKSFQGLPWGEYTSKLTSMVVDMVTVIVGWRPQLLAIWVSLQGFPGGSALVAQRLNRLPAMRETQVLSLGREDPLEKQMATHSSTLAWRIPWREEPGPWGCKELGTTGLLHFHFSAPFAIWPFVFPRSRTLRKSER